MVDNAFMARSADPRRSLDRRCESLSEGDLRSARRRRRDEFVRGIVGDSGLGEYCPPSGHPDGVPRYRYPVGSSRPIKRVDTVDPIDRHENFEAAELLKKDVEETLSYLREIPEIERISTVDEVIDVMHDLLAKPSGEYDCEVIGKSSLGQEIHRFTMPGIPQEHDEPDQKIKQTVLVFCDLHSNERFGREAVIQLMRLVRAHPELRKNCTWVFFSSSDPDGAKLAECDNPLDVTNYHENFYRETRDCQPEEIDSSSDNKDLNPEARAFKTGLDDQLPTDEDPDTQEVVLVGLLHDGDCGCTFCQLNRDIPGFAEAFAKVAEEQGEKDLAVASTDIPSRLLVAPGVFVDPGGLYNRSVKYVDKRDAYAIVSDAAWWIDKRIADPTPYPGNYQEFLGHAAEHLHKLTMSLVDRLEHLSPHLKINTPYLSPIADTLQIMREIKEEWIRESQSSSLEKAPTVASAATVELSKVRFTIRATSMLKRHLTAEIKAGNRDPEISASLTELETELTRLRALFEERINRTQNLRVIVALQAGTILLAAARLRHISR